MKLSMMADPTHADEVNPNKASASPADLSVRKRSHQTKLSMGYFPTMAASGPSGNDKVPMELTFPKLRVNPAHGSRYFSHLTAALKLRSAEFTGPAASSESVQPSWPSPSSNVSGNAGTEGHKEPILTGKKIELSGLSSLSILGGTEGEIEETGLISVLGPAKQFSPYRRYRSRSCPNDPGMRWSAVVGHGTYDHYGKSTESEGDAQQFREDDS